MRRIVNISLFVLLATMVSCRELPDYLVSSNTLARVGRNQLTATEVKQAIPSNLKGEDSVAFAKHYIDKWLVRQLKIEEADELFSNSVNDIEKMVEDYRQTLLTSKVDQHYVDKLMSNELTDEDIANYYNTHKSDFTLDRTLVKGRILRFDGSYRQSKRLKEQMRKAAASPTDAKTFSDVCEKNGFVLTDYRSEWISFSDFLANLPTTLAQDYDPLLDKMDIQEMEANDIRYYFDFTSVCRKGNVAPLEVVKENIRRILLTQRRSEIIKTHEEQIVKQAKDEGHARIYLEEKTNE
ncbi:MAG: hypothetical protein IJB87_07000 [Alistipes sp.]|nr:hypothetical protein [Rikenellaceae bacterium]MBQ3149090.1 hypothetical protein [Alistipes sp.]MBQ4126605.1 hypothetical protein [Alistipes sp.]